jgi:hypothetical protein
VRSAVGRRQLREKSFFFRPPPFSCANPADPLARTIECNRSLSARDPISPFEEARLLRQPARLPRPTSPSPSPISPPPLATQRISLSGASVSHTQQRRPPRPTGASVPTSSPIPPLTGASPSFQRIHLARPLRSLPASASASPAASVSYRHNQQGRQASSATHRNPPPGSAPQRTKVSPLLTEYGIRQIC